MSAIPRYYLGLNPGLGQTPDYSQLPAKAAAKKMAQQNCVRQYHPFIGPILKFFGIAFAMRDENNRIVFLNINSYIKRAVFQSSLGKAIRNDKVIKQIATEFLLQDTRKIIPIDSVRSRLIYLRQAIDKMQKEQNIPENDEKANKEIVIKALSQATGTPIHYQHDKEAIVAQLKPGDLVICCEYENMGLSAITRGAQKLIKSSVPGATMGSHNDIHLAMYIGDGMVAEATNTKGKPAVVTRSLFNRFDMKYGMGAEMRIIRCKNKALRESAVQLAHLYTKTKPKELQFPADKKIEQSPSRQEWKAITEPTQKAFRTLKKSYQKYIDNHARYAGFKYSNMTALKTIFCSASFKHSAKARILKELAKNELAITATLRDKPKGYICSQFVVWLLQAAETGTGLTEKLKNQGLKFPTIDHLKEPTFIEPAHPHGMSNKDYKKKLWEPAAKKYQKEYREHTREIRTIISNWADTNAHHFSKQLDELVNVRLDSKMTNPQDFHGFVNKNPGNFKEVLRIIPTNNPDFVEESYQS